MPQMTILQEFIARLDLYLPWLLPALETIELTVPASVRLVICALLLIWLAVLRQRHTVDAARRLHRVMVALP